MPPFLKRFLDAFERARQRRPGLDHVVRMVAHYNQKKGSLQAGAVTYFGFLSFFPILALSFATVGTVARIYPDIRRDLRLAIEEVLPNLIGGDEGQISLRDIEAAAPGIFSVGLLLVLYSGLGWLSAMRDALLVVFERPQKEQPNFFVGKAKDLVALAALGLVLVLSVTVSGVVTSLAEPILELLGLSVGVKPLLYVIALAMGLAASSVLFFAFFRLLADAQDVPARSLWEGALLGAVGFELLKLLSRYLLAATADQPAFQAFGIALILVVWINYFSRVVMYAAAWAYTTPRAREIRERAAYDAARQASIPEGPATGPAVVAGSARRDDADAAGGVVRAPRTARGRTALAAGGVAAGASALALAVARRFRR